MCFGMLSERVRWRRKIQPGVDELWSWHSCQDSPIRRNFTERNERRGEPPSLIQHKSIAQGLEDLSFSILHLYPKSFALYRRRSREL